MRALRWTPILILALLLPRLAGCSLGEAIAERMAFVNTKISFDRASLLSLDATDAHLDVVLDVANPNPVPATLDSLDYRLSLQGIQVANGTLAQGFSVLPGATGSFTVPVDVALLGLPVAVMQAFTARQATLTLAGTGHLSTPLGNVDVPVQVSQTTGL